MKKQCKLLLLLLFLPILGQANSDDFAHNKQKNIKKAYYVNADATVAIDNSYGTIDVTTWNQDIIEIDVTIKVSGDNEKYVNQRINNISVAITALKSIVSAKTILENTSYSGKSKNNNFEINYTIKIPNKGSVKLVNKYGSILVADINADADVTCKYGKVSMGKVAGNSQYNLEYCSNSSMNSLRNGTIQAKYSSIKITEVGKLNLTADYTDVEITSADFIKYDCTYGKIKFDAVEVLEATGNYLTIRLGEVSNTLKLTTQYSSLTVQNLTAKANNVSIKSDYTGISLGYHPNYAFDFNVNLKYANFKYSSDLELDNKEEVSNNKHFEGFHKKRGQNTISITSGYGNVTLTKNQ